MHCVYAHEPLNNGDMEMALTMKRLAAAVR